MSFSFLRIIVTIGFVNTFIKFFLQLQLVNCKLVYRERGKIILFRDYFDFTKNVQYIATRHIYYIWLVAIYCTLIKSLDLTSHNFLWIKKKQKGQNLFNFFWVFRGSFFLPISFSMLLICSLSLEFLAIRPLLASCKISSHVLWVFAISLLSFSS